MHSTAASGGGGPIDGDEPPELVYVHDEVSDDDDPQGRAAYEERFANIRVAAERKRQAEEAARATSNVAAHGYDDEDVPVLEDDSDGDFCILPHFLFFDFEINAR